MKISWTWPLKERGLMGVLNTTPDSFYDGGVHDQFDLALSRAQQMIQEGAHYIDIGGESSRPGAELVSLDEERRRVLPLIQALHQKNPEVIISVDTVKPELAEESIQAGARIINDIRGLRDPQMIEVAAKTGAGVVIMHMRGHPKTMQEGDLSSKEIVSEVIHWLRERVECAIDSGVDPLSIAIDPGIGFGKTVEQNLELLVGLPQLVQLGYPVLIGTSRKSFIGAIIGAEPKGRLLGTAASCCYALLQGASILRVHDISEMRDILLMTEALIDTQSKLHNDQTFSTSDLTCEGMV